MSFHFFQDQSSHYIVLLFDFILDICIAFVPSSFFILVVIHLPSLLFVRFSRSIISQFFAGLGHSNLFFSSLLSCFLTALSWSAMQELLTRNSQSDAECLLSSSYIVEPYQLPHCTMHTQVCLAAVKKGKKMWCESPKVTQCASLPFQTQLPIEGLLGGSPKPLLETRLISF